MKKVLSLIIAVVFLFVVVSCKSKSNVDIVSTTYVGYDFSRNVAKDKMNSSMLLKPGEELHDYSPSVSDIEKILDSKIFIYIGGESDSEFVEKDILPEINKKKTTVINMMDVVKNGGHIYDEEDPESYISDETIDEEEEEYDEHIWNSLTNAKLIINAIYEAIIKNDSSNKDYYLNNKDLYIEKIDKIDNNIKNVVNKANNKLIIFADRFPLLYFVKEYNLEYDAAFKGCETSKEANPLTIEKLTKKVSDNNIKIIFTIELSEANIASAIVENLKKEGKNVLVKTFYTMHNVSKEDFEKNMTYVDYLNINLNSLKEALN